MNQNDLLTDDAGLRYIVTDVHTRLWWRAIGPEPRLRLWCESSSEGEVREAAARAPEEFQPIRVQVLRKYTITPGWEDAER